MKRFYLTALALALGLGFANAQNITRSLQGSQDPRGPVGIDTSNNAFFGAHINATGNPSGATTTSCGAGAVLATGSTDVAGSVTVGGGASNVCIITFGGAFNATPACLFGGTYAASQNTVTIATTGFTVTGITSAVVMPYICIGNK